ncbi:MAG: hypothetical protein AAF743_05935 [Planctomycetota bacterium]
MELPVTLAVGLGLVDWGVVVGYFVVTTWIGHLLSGKQEDMDDFFLGGNKLPWYAVAGSMIATTISAVTFVGVPAFIFGVGGDMTYLQLGLIGGILARIFIAVVLIPAYYKERIFSPYDYMGNQLGGGVRGVMTTLFSIGGVLAQASRVYLTAIILELVIADELAWVEQYTTLSPLVSSIILIGAVATLWTLMGGIATVIWTDVILFAVFVIGGLIALVTILTNLDGGFGEFVAVGSAGEKFRLFDLGLDLDPTKEFTIWTAAIGTLFGNIGAYGTDQLLAQRLLTCKNQREAKKAILASYVAEGVTLLMLLVGIGLWVYYKGEPAVQYEQMMSVTTWSDGTGRQVVSGPEALPIESWTRPLPQEAAELFAEKNDRIFPLYILSDAIPVGLTGLIIAGIFAAAISSFDSILAALSQTTISAAVLPWLKRKHAAAVAADVGAGDQQLPLQRSETVVDPKTIVRWSRGLVVFWAVLLSVVAVLIGWYQDRFELPILVLALQLAAYVHGALFAAFLLAWLPLGINGRGLVWSGPLSVLCVVALRFHTTAAIWFFAIAGGIVLATWIVASIMSEMHLQRRRLINTLALLPGCAFPALIAWKGYFEDGVLAFPWWALVGGIVAFVWGLVLADRREEEPGGFPPGESSQTPG